MRKNIVFGSLLTILLLLLIPVLPAMEYQNTKDSDGFFIDKINLVNKQVDENNVMYSDKIENIEKLASIFGVITDQPDGICSCCQNCDPMCLRDLLEFMINMFLCIVFLCTIIFIPYGLDAFVRAQLALIHAKNMDCLWAKFLPFPNLSISLYPAL